MDASLPSDPADRVIAVHATHSGAETAVKTLERAGFDLATMRRTHARARASTP